MSFVRSFHAIAAVTAAADARTAVAGSRLVSASALLALVVAEISAADEQKCVMRLSHIGRQAAAARRRSLRGPHRL